MGFVLSKFVFLPPRPATYTETELDNIFYLKTYKNETIPCVFIPYPGAQYTILFSHGNAEDLGLIWEFLHLLSRLQKVNVMGYDYTGYGLATGKPSESHVYADIAAAFKYLLQEKQIPADRVIVFGRSLGSGPSVYLASKRPVAGVVLQSPLMSALRVVYNSKSTGAADMFDNISLIADITSPVFVIHGTEDDVVPFHHGLALYEKCQRPYVPYWVEGAGHNDIESGWFTSYMARLRDFVSVVKLHSSAVTSSSSSSSSSGAAPSASGSSSSRQARSRSSSSAAAAATTTTTPKTEKKSPDRSLRQAAAEAENEELAHFDRPSNVNLNVLIRS